MQNKKLFLTFAVWMFLLFSARMVFAQQSGIPSNDTRCSALSQQLTINQQPTVNGTPQNVGNLVSGLPQFCSPSQVILYAINVALIAAGSVAVLFIIVGGFFYVTAAGNEETSEKGRKILINSVIGLAVIILSAAIVRIVSGTLTGNLGSSGSSNLNSTSQQQSAAANSAAGQTQTQNSISGQSQMAAGPLSTVTQQDLQNYNKQDYLTAQFSLAPGASSGTVAVNANDHNSLVEIAYACSGQAPSVTLYDNGASLAYAPFSPNSANTGMTSTVSFNTATLHASDTLTLTVCGQAFTSHTVQASDLGVRQ